MTVVMILAMVLCANLDDTMLKRVMNQIGAVELSRAGLVHALRLTVTKGTLWIGILFLIAFTANDMGYLECFGRKGVYGQGIPGEGTHGASHHAYTSSVRHAPRTEAVLSALV
jgi:hypothetical protein